MMENGTRLMRAGWGDGDSGDGPAGERGLLKACRVAQVLPRWNASACGESPWFGSGSAGEAAARGCCADEGNTGGDGRIARVSSGRITGAGGCQTGCPHGCGSAARNAGRTEGGCVAGSGIAFAGGCSASVLPAVLWGVIHSGG